MFLASFPEKGILDYISHRPIIQVFTGNANFSATIDVLMYSSISIDAYPHPAQRTHPNSLCAAGSRIRRKETGVKMTKVLCRYRYGAVRKRLHGFRLL